MWMRRIVGAGRSAALAGVFAAALVLSAPSASAIDGPPDGGWGSMDCGMNPTPGCELGAGTPGSSDDPGRAARPSPEGSGPGQGGGGRSPVEAPGDKLLGPGTPLKNCRYVRSDYQPPEGATQTVSYQKPDGPVVSGEFVLTSYNSPPGRTSPGPLLAQQDPAGEEPGAWYVYRCSGDAGLQDGLYRPPVFIPDGEEPPGAGAPPPPSPEELAQQAYSQLRLPSPSIAASPEGPQLVRLPTWLWIENGWEPVSATASVPGVSVTATAKPTKVKWSMGEGGSRTCDGPGTPYSSYRNPRSASPDCGYTYRRASDDVGFRVTATISWSVSWSGAGQSGTFDDLSTSDSTRFVVEEVGAVNGR